MTQRLAQHTTIRPAASPAVRVPGQSCAHTAGSLVNGRGTDGGFGGFEGMRDWRYDEVLAGGLATGAR